MAGARRCFCVAAAAGGRSNIRAQFAFSRHALRSLRPGLLCPLPAKLDVSDAMLEPFAGLAQSSCRFAFAIYASPAPCMLTRPARAWTGRRTTRPLSSRWRSTSGTATGALGRQTRVAGCARMPFAPDSAGSAIAHWIHVSGGARLRRCCPANRPKTFSVPTSPSRCAPSKQLAPWAALPGQAITTLLRRLPARRRT